MKIAMGMLYHEANSFNPYLTNKDSFICVEGGEVIDRLYASEPFRQENAELVPLIYAMSLPNAIVEKDTYEVFAGRILERLKAHSDLDGIFLHLHGAMEVDGIGSGELDLITRIRELVGVDVVIGLAMDIHANNDPALAEHVNVMRAYRTVPHTDQEQTEKAVAAHMLKCIKQNIRTTPQFVRLPYAIHPEKALGNAWPLKEIFDTLDHMEQEEGIAIATLYVGMLWCDCPTLATSVAVTPTDERYTQKAKELALKLADYVYSFRDSFEFEQLPLSPHEAMRYALRYEGSPVYISDSGDNTTGGAVGDQTVMLREFLSCRDLNRKKVLVTNIWDENAVNECSKYAEGDRVALSVGTARDENCRPVKIEGVLKKKGVLNGYMGCAEDIVGKTVTISVGNLDFVITDKPGSFISFSHFSSAGLDVSDYQVIVVKQGYLFAELSKAAKLAILALTPGATHQIIENLHFKRIVRPLYPFK